MWKAVGTSNPALRGKTSPECVCDDWRGDQVTQVKDFPERKWWHTPGIPATQEDEAGGYLRPAWQLSRAQFQNTIKETGVGWGLGL